MTQNRCEFVYASPFTGSVKSKLYHDEVPYTVSATQLFATLICRYMYTAEHLQNVFKNFNYHYIMGDTVSNIVGITGAFTTNICRKASFSLAVSVCLSARNNSRTVGRIFMAFYI
jgi:hypothetical protein